MNPAPGMLVEFTLAAAGQMPERQIAAQVITLPPGLTLPWWLAIDVNGELYDRQPHESWHPLPKHLAGQTRARTDTKLRHSDIRQRIALMFDPQAIVRLRAKPARQRGTDKEWAKLATKNMHGRLAPGDIPERLAHWGSSHLSAPFEARIVWSWDATRRRQFLDAVTQLSAGEEAAIGWCLIGRGWSDETGRWIFRTIQPCQFAAQRQMKRQTVYKQLERGYEKLVRMLDFDPGDYCWASPDPEEMGPPDMDEVAA